MEIKLLIIYFSEPRSNYLSQSNRDFALKEFSYFI